VKKAWILLIIASLALSVTVPVLYGGMDAIAAVRRISLWAVASLLGMVLGGWLFNAARIRLLARSLGNRLTLGRALATVLSSEFAGLATPANAGLPATYVFLLNRQGLSVAHSVAVVAVDHFMNLVFFATTVPLAIVLYLTGSGISHPSKIGVLVLGLLCAGVMVLVWLLRHYRSVALVIGRLLHRIPRLRPLRFRLARALIQFRHGIRLLLAMGFGKLFLLYLYCLGHWMLRYGILPVLLWYMGKEVPWGYLFVMQGLLLFVGQITFLPGGGGGVEVGFSVMLTPYLDATTTASALLVWRFCTFYWYLLAGAPTFVMTTGETAGRLVASRSS
jgi:uncharacterized protein (TIRG00374 family)